MRRRGRLNSRGFHGDLLRVCGGLQDFDNVDFLVLSRPECQLTGLVCPRDSVVASLSDSEAGVTLVVCLACVSQDRWISTTFGFALIRATARPIQFLPMFSGLFLEELALSGVSYIAGIW